MPDHDSRAYTHPESVPGSISDSIPNPYTENARDRKTREQGLTTAAKSGVTKINPRITIRPHAILARKAGTRRLLMGHVCEGGTHRVDWCAQFPGAEQSARDEAGRHCAILSQRRGKTDRRH